MDVETALKLYKDDSGYKVVQFAKDVMNGSFSGCSDVEIKDIFSKMLHANTRNGVFVSKSVALYESSIFSIGLNYFKSIESIKKFFVDNKKEKTCDNCRSSANVANFCLKTGLRKVQETENFDREFIEICRKAKFNVRCSDTGVSYFCLKCFTKILTAAYINENKSSVIINDNYTKAINEINEVMNGVKKMTLKQNNGCYVGNKEKKEMTMNNKFAKINSVTTATDGQLAIVKNGIAYVLDAENQLVPVAAGVTTDMAYANIRVVVGELKERDVVVDPVNGNPVFVESAEGTRVTFRDVLNATSVVRDFVPDEITGEATVTKLISVIKLVRGNRNILPVINRYGKDTVFDVMINQYLSYGDVDAARIEAEINPTMIQLEMTRSMSAMTKKVGELVDTLENKE